MPRFPKGTISRIPPDWYASRAASAGCNNPSQPGSFACTDLFNDATDGSYLWVYWLYLQNSGTFSIRVYPFNGHTSGFQDGPGLPLNPAVASIPGHVWIGFEGSHAVPITNQYESSVNAPVIDYINPPGPLMIIPPGWSMRCINNQTDFGFVANFYWIAIKDLG